MLASSASNPGIRKKKHYSSAKSIQNPSFQILQLAEWQNNGVSNLIYGEAPVLAGQFE